MCVFDDSTACVSSRHGNERTRTKIFKESVLIGLCLVVACRSDTPVSPPAPPQVYCGEVPSQIYNCLKLPKIIGENVTSKCGGSTSPCERVTCTFRESGFLVDAKVDKKKVSEHYERFGAEHPEWMVAVRHVQAACLERDLPSQGLYLNCPAYDIMWCAFTSFIRSAQPSQWTSTEKCAYPRQYSAACPVCPSECFAPAVPVGACNACLALPRTP